MRPSAPTAINLQVSRVGKDAKIFRAAAMILREIARCFNATMFSNARQVSKVVSLEMFQLRFRLLPAR